MNSFLKPRTSKADESPRSFFMVELDQLLYPDRVHESCLLSIGFIQV